MSNAARVLLDTSAVIDLERIDLGEHVAAEATVSAISIAELAYGLDIDDPVQRQARTDRYVAVLSGMEVLAFDLAAARIYGTLAALVRHAGRSPRPRRMDLQIAATAASHGLPLLTRNAADFAGLERVLDVIAV